MIFFLTLVIVSVTVFKSIRLLFIPHTIKGKRVSVENFLFLVLVYATVMLGFGILYQVLELQGYRVLHESVVVDSSQTYVDRLETSLYFSAITLFSVGYGDISPVGIGRAIAVMEALIGYTIPAAFVARAVIDREKES